jgi:DNA-binding NarL/FixJ family response regulator
MKKSETKEYISAQNKRARLKRISKPINDKEIVIIKMVCAELTSKEIAKATNQSYRTVENSRQIIMKKIGCDSSFGIMKYAIQEGIFKL